MERQTVHLYVFDTLADWETGFAIAGINNPMFAAQPGRYHVQTVGSSMEPITTIGGMRILPDIALDELQPEQSTMLILPGGNTWDEGKNLEAAHKAAAFLEAGVPVAAICGATSGLARIGILDNKRHTSNALEYLQALNYQGAQLYQNQPAVTDDNLITAGSTAPIDFAYHIFKKLEVYNDEVLEGWYGLFKTGDPSYFYKLQKGNAPS